MLAHVMAKRRGSLILAGTGIVSFGLKYIDSLSTTELCVLSGTAKSA